MPTKKGKPGGQCAYQACRRYFRNFQVSRRGFTVISLENAKFLRYQTALPANLTLHLLDGILHHVTHSWFAAIPIDMLWVSSESITLDSLSEQQRRERSLSFDDLYALAPAQVCSATSRFLRPFTTYHLEHENTWFLATTHQQILCSQTTQTFFVDDQAHPDQKHPFHEVATSSPSYSSRQHDGFFVQDGLSAKSIFAFQPLELQEEVGVRKVPSLDDLYTLQEPAERDGMYSDQDYGGYEDSEADDATVMSMPAYPAGEEENRVCVCLWTAICFSFVGFFFFLVGTRLHREYITLRVCRFRVSVCRLECTYRGWTMARVHVHSLTCTRVHWYTHTHTYIHKYIHTHGHTHTQPNMHIHMYIHAYARISQRLTHTHI